MTKEEIRNEVRRLKREVTASPNYDYVVGYVSAMSTVEGLLYDLDQPKRPRQSIASMLQMFTEDICDNYCKYRGTCDEEAMCDIIRNGGECPLDLLV